jgi:DNA-binding MarR family transcriptional regulator
VYNGCTHFSALSDNNSDEATVGDVILRLCEKGHLDKSMDTKDRRAFTVSLSPDSMKMVKEIEEIGTSITAKALMGMEQKEIEIFYKVLMQIMINLS